MPDKTPRFPLFLDLSQMQVLLVGGGAVAVRRAKTLVRYGPDLTVIAPRAEGELDELAAQGRLKLRRRAFEDADLTGQFLVLAATDDRELNTRIAALARRKGSFANNASDREDCDFFFPAVVLEEKLSIGLCGNGEDHRAVAKAAGAIRRLFRERNG